MYRLENVQELPPVDVLCFAVNVLDPAVSPDTTHEADTTGLPVELVLKDHRAGVSMHPRQIGLLVYDSTHSTAMPLRDSLSAVSLPDTGGHPDTRSRRPR